MSSGTALNDALFSGSVQVATGGLPPSPLVWAKTQGNFGVKGLSPFNSMPRYLNTRNPEVKTIKDFTDKDRIAKSSLQVTLPRESTPIVGRESRAKQPDRSLPREEISVHRATDRRHPQRVGGRGENGRPLP